MLRRTVNLRHGAVAPALLVWSVLVTACSDRVSEPQVAAQAATTRDSDGGRPTSAASPANVASLPDFAALVERFGAAVVNVEVVGSRRVAEEDDGDPLMDFFRQFGVPSPDGPEVPEHGDTLLMRGAGSGFIVSADGYILTNAHVLEGADEVTVRLTDRREFPAKVVGADARTDVAVIKIEGRELHVVRIAERPPRSGEWVLAIGSPFGLENTATAGIVSSTARAVSGELAVPFIQTDVAVNPGNSGGPLFNLDGEVIGMNSMIFSETGGYMGISFAVPIDLAMDVRAQLVDTGHVVRGRIGVAVQDVDADLARSLGLDRPHGALVSIVEKGGPAARAGVKPGDVIVLVGQAAVEQRADLSNAIARIAPGREMPLRIWRGGRALDLQVRVARVDEPQQRQARAAVDPAQKGNVGARLGLGVRSLTPEEKKLAGTEGNIVVESVAGAALRAGMQPGDIILAVNSRAVDSEKELRALAGRLRNGDAAALLIERDGAHAFVSLRISAG